MTPHPEGIPEQSVPFSSEPSQGTEYISAAAQVEDSLHRVRTFVKKYASGPLTLDQEQFDQRQVELLHDRFPDISLYLQKSSLWPRLVSVVASSEGYLQGLLKYSSPDVTVSEEVLLSLLRTKDGRTSIEQFTPTVLLLFLKHPSSTPQVQEEVFRFIQHRRRYLYSDFLTKVVTMGKMFGHSTVVAFERVMLCDEQGVLSPHAVEEHLVSLLHLLRVGEWIEREVDALCMLCGEDSAVSREIRAAYSENTTQPVFQENLIELSRQSEDPLLFMQQCVVHFGGQLPFSYVHYVLQEQLYSRVTLQEYRDVSGALDALSSLSAEMSEDACMHAWEHLFPWMCSLGSPQDISAAFKVLTSRVPFPEELLEVVLQTYPDSIQFLGSSLVQRFVQDREALLFLLRHAKQYSPLHWHLMHESIRLPNCDIGLATSFLQRVSSMPLELQEEFRTSYWKYYGQEFMALYRMAAHREFSSAVLPCFYQQLFEAGAVSTFEQLSELYAVLPDTPEKAYMLTSLFIRPSTPASLLRKIQEEGCWNFSGAERLHLLKKIGEVLPVCTTQ